jgi:DNA-binding IclR family transcriptional regulator
MTIYWNLYSVMWSVSNRAVILWCVPELPASAPSVQVVDRAIDLLEALQASPMSLAELCRATGISRPTASRLLSTLASRAIVIREEPSGVYAPGPNLLRLARASFDALQLLLVPAHPELERLSFETGETVALHIRSGVERVYVDEVPSQHSIRYTALVGSIAPIEAGSSGTVLIAFADPPVREELLGVLSAATTFERGRMQARIDRARRDGFAIDLGSRLTGASAISVPVNGHGLLLSLSVIGPSGRLSTKALEDLVPSMRRVGAKLEALLV